MNNCKTVMVTSCKGGVGKSTVSANLGIKLAMNGFKTLIIDCDFGVRSLDLIMGLEDRVIFDITDVILRDIEPQKAFIRLDSLPNLFFCSAPYNYNYDFEIPMFMDTVKRIGEEMEFDFIIIDTPGDTGIPFRLASSVSDIALVVSTYQPSSIRAAERTGILLSEEGVSERKLIINCFDAASVQSGTQPGLLEIIDKTCIQLIGIIPYDSDLADYQAKGMSVFDLKFSNAAVAVSNIADRITGRNIPLFTGFKKVKRISLLKNIR